MIRLLTLLLAIAGGTGVQQLLFHSDARLVEVYATVLDERGKFMDGLIRDRFIVSEDGQPQDVVAFESETAGVDCAIVIDTTGSMQAELPRLKNAVAKFIYELRDVDSVAIYSFTTSLTLLQDFTQDRAVAKRAVMRTRAEGQTALFDAIAQVTQALSERSRKRAAVVFTDGDDNSSVLRARAAIDRAKKAGIPIYTVAQGEALKNAVLLKELKEIASATGAAMFEARKPTDVVGIFQEILGDLQHIYLLAYRPPTGDRIKWRSIRLEVTGLKSYKVRTKNGYFPE